MEFEDRSIPAAHFNDIANNNNNNNVNPISSQHASNNDSPTASTGKSDSSSAAAAADSSAIKTLHHRRAHSDGNFLISAAAEPFNGSFTACLGEMVSEDDLLSAFLDLQKLGQNEDDGGAAYLMDHCGGNGGQTQKSFTRCSGDSNGPQKATPPEKFAELWAGDPKRVKRILANRKSAARSRERKARYLVELERRVQSLQSEAKNLSAQLTIYQRDTTGLGTENAELKMRLQAMEHQAHFRDAINEALKQEVERLGNIGEMKTHQLLISLGARAPCSRLASPSTLQTMQYNSSLTTPSTLPTMSCSRVPPTKPPVHVPGDQLPPLHNSQSTLPSCHFRPENFHTPGRSDSLSRLHGLHISSRGSNLVNTEGHPVSSSESSSTA